MQASEILSGWRRHDLLRVRPATWPKTLRMSAHLAAVPHVARWAERGWPLVVRRRAEKDAVGMIPAAFPLPPECGKLRIAVQVAPPAVLERLLPVLLRAAREKAPLAWQESIDALLTVANHVGVEPLVYGSLLWQHLTNLPYLSTTSDLDLLWPVDNQNRAFELAQRLAALEAVSPMRLDGEILLPNGGGVQWREFFDRPSEVLVKDLFGVQLRSTFSLFVAPALAA